jgi:hypothetical protein
MTRRPVRRKRARHDISINYNYKFKLSICLYPFYICFLPLGQNALHGVQRGLARGRYRC